MPAAGQKLATRSRKPAAKARKGARPVAAKAWRAPSGKKHARSAAALEAAYHDPAGIDPAGIARGLGLTRAELADTLGLPANALMRAERIGAEATQQRLKEFVDILQRVESWSGGLRPALTWYRSQTIPGLGDSTPEVIVKADRAHDLRAYLDQIEDGGFA